MTDKERLLDVLSRILTAQDQYRHGPWWQWHGAEWRCGFCQRATHQDGDDCVTVEGAALVKELLGL